MRGNFHLTIIGDGPDEISCKKLAEKLEIAEIITFLGNIPNKDVIRTMKNSDLLFFTSLKEGTATVVLEALAVGVPVLCHDTCGLEILSIKIVELKIPMVSYGESVDLFADALSTIAEDRTILPRLSKGAIKESSYFTYQINAEKMNELYTKCIK